MVLIGLCSTGKLTASSGHFRVILPPRVSGRESPPRPPRHEPTHEHPREGPVDLWTFLRTGRLAVDNDEAVIHRARLCPQAPPARKPVSQKPRNPIRTCASSAHCHIGKSTE